MTRLISALAALDGHRRSAFSCRSFRQPHTRSKPRSACSINSGMSSGKCCRSESIETTNSPTRATEAGLKRRGLTEVATQLDHAQPRLRIDQVARESQGVVRAAVIDEHDFETISVRQRVANSADAADKFRERGRLVVDRRNNADQRARTGRRTMGHSGEILTSTAGAPNASTPLKLHGQAPR